VLGAPARGKEKIVLFTFRLVIKRIKNVKILNFMCPVLSSSRAFFVYRIISIEHECTKDTHFDQVIKEFAITLARAHKFGYTTV